MQRRAVSILWMVLCCGFAVSCGDSERENGDGIHGTIVSNGITIEYESFRSKRSAVEKAKGSPGIATRIAVEGNTLSSTSGGYYPPEWDKRSDGEDSIDYSKIDWADVMRQFEAIPIDPKYSEDRQMILSELKWLRDSPMILPPSPHDHRLTETELRQADTEIAALLNADDADDLQNPVQVSWFTDRVKDAHAMKETFIACANQKNQDLQSALVAPCTQVALAASDMLNRGFRDRTRQPGWEYKQVLHLYKMPAFQTGWDHSGTITESFKRSKGSGDDAWVRFSKKETCNHGSCPEKDPAMKHYETCDSGVISDWYVIDGECRGNWFQDHFCNDDTSLQIAHANGIWTGDQCPGAKRAIAPHCGRQWSHLYDDIVLP